MYLFELKNTPFNIKTMNSRLILNAILTIALLIPITVSAQNTVKLRLSGNSTRFTKEQQGQELLYWEVDTFISRYGPFTDFTHSGGFGGEAELMMSLTDKVWIGLEISSDNLSGDNDNPGVFNFQYTDFNQLTSTDTSTGVITTHITNYPIKYKTNLLNFMGNLRIYPVSGTRVRPFLKASAGLSLVSTELALKSPSVWIDEDNNPNAVYGAPVIFSRGQSSSPEGVEPAFTFGGGVGVEFQITEKIAAYGDYSYRLVKSDIIDGKPNFDWFEETGKMERFNTLSSISRFSIGIVYTLWNDAPLLGGGGGGGKSSGQNSGRIHPYLPFHKLKRP